MQDLNEFSVPKGFRGDDAIKVQLWWTVQTAIFAWSPQVSYHWRIFLLRLFGTKIEKSVVTHPSVKTTYLWKLTLGDYTWIGDDANLYTLGEITIGTHSTISQESYLCTGNHDHTSQHFTINATPIVIGKKCRLATDILAAPGVMIGDGTVVGARGSVLEPPPTNVVCRGSPAVVIRERVGTEWIQKIQRSKTYQESLSSPV